MKKFAVVCAAGIGDALLMQIAARHLRDLGHETVTVSKHLKELSDWFPGFQFSDELVDCDAMVLQHDNSTRAFEIHAGQKPVYTFFGSHVLSKHGPLRKKMDFVFDPSICMAENILAAMQELFGIDGDLGNGLVAPKQFVKQPNRVVLHTGSASAEKNWPESSFFELQERLEADGWETVILPFFPNLSQLATFLYESAALIGNDSGPGHLASNLGLPTVIIGPNKEQLTFWRPGWRRGEIVYPPSWTTQFKLTRKYWKQFISVNHVYKVFNKIVDTQ